MQQVMTNRPLHAIPPPGAGHGFGLNNLSVLYDVEGKYSELGIRQEDSQNQWAFTMECSSDETVAEAMGIHHSQACDDNGGDLEPRHVRSRGTGDRERGEPQVPRS